MYTRKTIGIGVTLLLCAVPQLSAAVAGCNNGYLLGNYNAEVTNLNLQSTLQTLSGTGGTVTPAGTGSTGVSAGSTGSTVAGFANNPASLTGAVQGSSRFYFDGAGTIVGLSTPAGGNTAVPTAVGSYSVDTTCKATIKLNSGASFDAVLADSGRTVVFLETDSSNLGLQGVLQRSSSCVSLNYPQSFAFSFAGASPTSTSGSGGTSGTSGSTGTSGTSGSTGTSGTSGSTGTSGTSGSTGTTGQAGGSNGLTFGAFSQIGTISTDGNGNFLFTQTMISNGQVTRSTGGGTYSVDANCSLRLSFQSNAPGTTSNFVAPTSISGLTTDSSGGVLVSQPNSSTSPLTGTFIVQ